MRIEEVRIRNVRSYGNNTTTLAFRPGLNVLLGRIGCGKSSVLESILICLFGFSKSGIRKNDVLRKNATSDALQIELTFFFDGMHFKVARGNETRLESSPDGMSWTLISENSTEIDKFLETTLEVTARKFRDLFYATQGELTNVITGSPEERQKSIDKLLGAEGLRETYEHLAGFTKHFDQDIGKAEGQLRDIEAYLKRSDLDEMRDQKRVAEGEVIRVGREMQAVSQDIAAIAGELEDLAGRSKPLEEANLEIQSLQRENAEREAEAGRLAVRVEELEKRSAALSEDEKSSRERLEVLEPEGRLLQEEMREKEAECRRLVDLGTRGRALVERLSEVSADVESLKERREKESQNAEEIGKRIKASREELEETSKRRAQRRSEHDSLEEGLKETREGLPGKEEVLRSAELRASSLADRAKENAKKITNLQSISEGSQCPFCEQPISEAHRAKVVTRIESVIKQLLREEEAAKTEVGTAREGLKALEDEIEAKTSDLGRIGDEIAGLDRDSAREEQNASNLADSLSESEGRRDRWDEEIAAKTDQLGKLNAEMDEIRAESKAAGDDWLVELEKLSREAEEEQSRRRERLREVESEIASMKKILARAIQDGQRIGNDIRAARETLAGLRERIDAFRGEIARRYEPLIGEAEDPVARITEMLSQIGSEIEVKKDALNARNLVKVQLSNEYKQREEQIAQLVEKIEEYISEQARREAVRRTHTVYCEARNILQQMRDRYKDAREMIRTNLINVLRELLRVEFEKLYTYEDFHDLKISDDYEVSLQSPVGEIQAHNLSAGQKAITAIAFRLAVAKAMEMKIGCWIIDEPTQNIGKAEVEALADVLADTSKIPQIVIATHHEALGRNGNVISLGIRNGESVLGEGGESLRDEPPGD